MLCWICNSVEVNEIVLDHRDGKIRHCSQCENVIQENLQSISRERQDDGEDPIIDQVFDDDVAESLEPGTPPNVFLQQGYHSSGDGS